MSTAPAAAPPESQMLLSINDIAALTGIAVGTLRAWIIAGRFPAADLAHGHKLRRWKRATVLSWIDGK